jgi:2-oxopent-4-enoate/cis-2-oxohex-4-enoate hydratase
VTKEDVLAATEWVAPCFEIVDSRINDWKIKIQDTVADNASCGVFVIGKQHTDPASLDLAAAAMQMQERPARRLGPGQCRARPPCRSRGLAGQHPGRFRHSLQGRRGDSLWLLAPLVPAAAGDRFEMVIEGMGSCSIQFTE